MNANQKEKILNGVYERGFNYEKKYRCCSQSTLKAVQDVFCIDENDFKAIFKTASSLSGGVCGSGKRICGALVGSIMMIAYHFGRDLDNFDKMPDNFKDRGFVNEYRKIFTKTYGGETCNQIQEAVLGKAYNLLDKKEFELFEEAGAHKDKCTNVVGTAARWVTSFLIDNGIEPVNYFNEENDTK
jgi:C_GCAxxG_C_C family probable redox protein